MVFASCDGVQCVGGSSGLAHTIGKEFAGSVNLVSSASRGATNDALPQLGSQEPALSM